jgi:hypothetical protein
MMRAAEVARSLPLKRQIIAEKSEKFSPTPEKSNWHSHCKSELRGLGLER